MSRWVTDKPVQVLTIKAVTPESVRALYNALAAFEPEWDTDEKGNVVLRVGPVQQRGARDAGAWNDERRAEKASRK